MCSQGRCCSLSRRGCSDGRPNIDAINGGRLSIPFRVGRNAGGLCEAVIIDVDLRSSCRFLLQHLPARQEINSLSNLVHTSVNVFFVVFGYLYVTLNPLPSSVNSGFDIMNFKQMTSDIYNVR